MVNDIVLTGQLNLFALLGAGSMGDRVADHRLIDAYLSRHFGIRDRGLYLDLFEDCCQLYEDETIDRLAVAKDICSNVKQEIEATAQKLLLLRLMEWCAGHGTESLERNEQILRFIGEAWGVDDALWKDMHDFATGRPSDKVKIHRFAHYDGYFRTLWMEEQRRMLFTYVGEDAVTCNDVPVVAGVYQVWDESAVVKNMWGNPIYYAALRRAYAATKDGETQRTYLRGKDIDFRYPGSDNGLHEFSFSLQGGEMVAIMGSSGAGKTTLLSLLTGSLRPGRGSISVCGIDVSQKEAKELIGYVPQDDLLVEELTVYQNLWYTARLCFGEMDEAETHRRVENVLRSLELQAVKDLKVGSPIRKTISGGQRKRLNIALELIREPSVLMLDEPTSGLSSADAERVVGLLKQLTYDGKLVIVNIHQPSSEVYRLFDRLWLLDRGGYPVYDGNPIDAISYFKRWANYADPETSTCPTCGNVHPELVLNIIDEKALDSQGNITDQRKTTPQEWNAIYKANRPEEKRMESGDGANENGEMRKESFSSKKTGTFSILRWNFNQWAIQTERCVMSKLTNLQYMLLTLLEAPVLACICAWLTHYAPTGASYTLWENKNFASFLFMAVIVMTFVGMSGSAEEIIRDRALLKREKFLNLSYASYISSKVTLCAVVSLVQSLLFVVVGQAIMGFHDLTLEWWGILFATSMVASLTGLLLSQSLSSVVAIYISIPLLLIPQILLCGVVVDFDDLNTESRTGNVPLIGEVIPSRWAYEALAVTTMADNEFEAPLFEAHRKHYQCLYYSKAYVYELQSRVESIERRGENGEQRAEDSLVIATELPRLAAFCGMEPYGGTNDYDSLKAWLTEAETLLSRRGNEATLALDRIVCARVEEQGSEGYAQLKREHCNRRLQDMLTGVGAEKLYDVAGGSIVSRAGRIYLDPVTHDGRTPFYSAYKQVGETRVKTLWWNLMVLALMAVACGTLLYMDIPGKVRNNKL